jgi:endo-1,4-beta-xylanase
MRRPRTFETFAAGALAIAVVLAPVAGTDPISTAEAAPVTVAVDLEDEAFQGAQVDYAVAVREGGYVVEAAINLLDSYGGPGTFHGLDFQVNDASTGAPRNVHNWADPSGIGYQSTARWGVGRLAPATEQGPVVSLGLGEIKAGGTVPVTLDGFEPGETVELYLSETGPGVAAVSLAAAPGDTLLTSLVVGGDGSAAGMLTVPATTPAGTYWVNAEVSGSVIAGAELRVLAADGTGTGGSDGNPGGSLARTGAELAGLVLAGLLLTGLGAGLLAARRRARTPMAG